MEQSSHSSSTSSSSSTAGIRGGGSSARYPDLVLQRGNVSSEFPGRTSTATSVTPINPTPSNAQASSSSSSRLRCSNCNENSVLKSCSCNSHRNHHHANNERRGSSNTKSPTVIEVGEVTLGMDNTPPDFIAKSISEQNVHNMNSRTKKFSGPSIKYERKWEYFPGKNKFYFNGILMTAPSIRFCMLSFILILVTFVLFTIFDAPYLSEHLTPVIPVIGSILFLLVIVNMLKTSCSDPGILPRASAQESEFIEKSYANPNGLRPPPRTRDIIVNGQTIKSKYCFTCKMFRPPRASHCGVCDNCVDRFDHHCPFLGNCIGKRNYRNFYTFIVSLSLLAVFVLSCSITHLALRGKQLGNFLEALRESPTSAIVILISFLGMWTVIGLAGFHTYLIAVEQTTNEDIKGMFGRANSVNPYTRGNFCRNCCFILCGPHQPSLIDSRGIVTSEFLASLPKTKGGGNENENISVAPCSLPPPRPHCGEGSNTPRNGGGQQEQFQITNLVESGSHKARHGPSKVISPTTTNSPPVVLNTRNTAVANIPKGSSYTVPGESDIMTSPQMDRNPKQSLEYLPIYNNSRRSYHLSDENSLYSPTSPRQDDQSCELGSLSTPASNFLSTTTTTTTTAANQNTKKQGVVQDMSLSMVQLDFPPDYNSPPLRSNNNRKSPSTMGGVSSTNQQPLIPTNNTKHYHQQQQQQQQLQQGRMYTNNKDFMYLGDMANGQGHNNRMSSSSNSAVHAPVALAFDEDEEDSAILENLTMINDNSMINSPLDLDDS